MAYDFDIAFLDNLQTRLERVISTYKLIEGISPPGSQGIEEYVPLFGSEKPQSLTDKLVAVEAFITAQYKELEKKPTYNQSWPVDIAFAQLLSEISSIEYTPVPVVLHTDNQWLLTDTALGITQELEKVVQDGEISFWADWQSAQYAKDDGRNIQAVRDAMDRAGSAIGSRGFRKPTSRLKALQSEAIYKYQASREEKNIGIMGMVASHAQEAMSAGIAAGSALEDICQGFTSGYNSLIVKAKRQAVELYKARLEAEVLKHAGLVKEARYPVEWQVGYARQELDRISGIIETFKADVQHNLITNEKTKYYLSAHDAFVSTYNQSVRLIKTQVNNKAVEVETNIEKTRLASERYYSSLSTTLTGLSNINSAATTAMAAANASQITVNKKRR